MSDTDSPNDFNYSDLSPLGGLSPSICAERAIECAEKLAGLGVPVPASHRLQRVSRAIRTNNTPDRAALPEAGDIVGGAMVAVLEAVTIVRAHEANLSRVRAGRAAQLLTADHLQRVLRGPFPSQFGREDKAANFRFEAFVGALLYLSSTTVARGEPDWRLHYHGEQIGIPVKRLNSPTPENAFRLIKSAAKQLRAQGLRGVVVLNVEGLLNGMPTNTDVATIQNNLDTRLRYISQKLDGLVHYPEVIGVWFSALLHEARFGGEGKPRLHFSDMNKVVCFSDIEPPERLDAFFRHGLFPRVQNTLLATTNLLRVKPLEY